MSNKTTVSIKDGAYEIQCELYSGCGVDVYVPIKLIVPSNQTDIHIFNREKKHLFEWIKKNSKCTQFDNRVAYRYYKILMNSEDVYRFLVIKKFFDKLQYDNTRDEVTKVSYTFVFSNRILFDGDRFLDDIIKDEQDIFSNIIYLETQLKDKDIKKKLNEIEHPEPLGYATIIRGNVGDFIDYKKLQENQFLTLLNSIRKHVKIKRTDKIIKLNIVEKQIRVDGGLSSIELDHFDEEYDIEINICFNHISKLIDTIEVNKDFTSTKLTDKKLLKING